MHEGLPGQPSLAVLISQMLDRHRQMRAQKLAGLACLALRRVDEAGLGEADLRARLQVGDALIHFEHASDKELLYLHVEEFILSFEEAPYFSATHREDLSALALSTEGIRRSARLRQPWE